MIEARRILLVEDNEGDIILTRKALNSLSEIVSIDVIKDGEMALQFLRKNSPFEEADTPELILLDINLPKIDGREVLTLIKNDEKLRIIPVVMLTTSDSEKDINQCYLNHANCFITKPVDFASFKILIHTLINFWIKMARLPKTKWI